MASSRISMASQNPDQFGVQLYVLRDLLAKDFDGTLRKVASIGIKNIEFAGFYNRTANDVKSSLSNAGLTASGAHCLRAAMSDDEISRTINFARRSACPT